MNAKLLIIILTVIAICARNRCRAVNGNNDDSNSNRDGRRYRTHTRLPFNEYNQHCEVMPTTRKTPLKSMVGITSNTIKVFFGQYDAVYVAKPDSMTRYPYVVKRTKVQNTDLKLVFPISHERVNRNWDVVYVRTRGRQLLEADLPSPSLFRPFDKNRFKFVNKFDDLRAIFKLEPKRTIPKRYYYVVIRKGHEWEIWMFDTSSKTSTQLTQGFALDLSEMESKDVKFQKFALFNGFDSRSRDLTGLAVVRNSTLFQYFTMRLQKETTLKPIGPFMDIQVLLGCPQTLCVYAAVDAASHNDKDSITTIVAGRFFWELGYGKDSKVKVLNNEFEVIGNANGYVEDVVDAMFVGNDNERVFVSGSSLLFECVGCSGSKRNSKKGLLKQQRNKYFNYLLSDDVQIDAATNVNIDGVNTLYLFSGSIYYVYRHDLELFYTTNDDKFTFPISDFGFPSDLDAAFIHDSKVHAMKANYMYEADLTKKTTQCSGTPTNCRVIPEDYNDHREVKLFQKYFKTYCELQSYSQTFFNSYGHYLKWWQDNMKEEDPPETAFQKWRTQFLWPFLAIVLIMVPLFLAVAAAMCYKNKLYESLAGQTNRDKKKKRKKGEGLIFSTISSTKSVKTDSKIKDSKIKESKIKDSKEKRSSKKSKKDGGFVQWIRSKLGRK